MSDISKSRIPELDGLRVLMIAIVSWYHIWQQSWLFPNVQMDPAARKWLYSSLGIDASLFWLVRTGYVWVDGTILISVFLLYLPWAEAKRAGAPAPDARDFYFRRARRIIPAFYFIVVCHLLIIALPWKQYGTNTALMVKDLVTHLTFSFTRWSDTYQGTHLGGAAWTVAVLMQGYLLFPLIAYGMRKRPALTVCLMLLLCYGFRAWCIWGLSSYGMVVNQLINFLDVYVIGILCAICYIHIRKRQETKPASRRNRYIREIAMTLLFFVSLYGLIRMLQLQEAAGMFPNDYQQAHLQRYQMMYRPVFALCFAGLIMTAPFALLPLRKLMGNPVTRFLAGISMNYYLIHQTVAVHLMTRLKLPWTNTYLACDYKSWSAWLFERKREILYPNTQWDAAWQGKFAWLCAGVSLMMAIAVTYLIEKPAARLMNRIREKRLPKQASEHQV